MMEVIYWNDDGSYLLKWILCYENKNKIYRVKRKKYRIEFKNKNFVCYFYDIIDRGCWFFGFCWE